MSWKRRLLNSFNLYAITDLKSKDSDFLKRCEIALESGVDILQLRSKSLSDLELYRLGVALRRITLKRKKLFIVNDRFDLALALGADGVHLGQEDLPISIAKRMRPDKDFIIGKSTHSIRQACTAEKEGVDYIGFGPIFSTPTKPTYKPIGLSEIRAVHRRVKIPIVCIGGIDKTNLDYVMSAGAQRVAVVRAIFDQKKIKSQVLSLKGRFEHGK